MCTDQEIENLLLTFIRAFEDRDPKLLEEVFHDDFDFYNAYDLPYLPSRLTYQQSKSSLSVRDWYIEAFRITIEGDHLNFQNVKIMTKYPEATFLADIHSVLETGELGTPLPYISFSEFKDGKIYRQFYMIDRLTQFIKSGKAALATDDRAKLQQYLRELKTRGLLG